MTAVHDRAAWSAFQDAFSGAILEPGSPDYDGARTIFNAMIHKRPAVIAQCRGREDVAAALAYARRTGLEVAVRGGGHSVAGKSLTEGGLVIDLRHMNGVSVNPDAGIATVAGGATMSHLDRATQPHNLATTGGRVSTTGVGGFTLGGGGGWLDRKFGLACDNLVSVDLVTADGRFVTASESENPDLFWALHGGGGNFGVATSFRLRLYPLGNVTAALLLWPPEKGVDILQTYRDFMAGAPDDVGGGVLYLTAPALDFVPPQLVGNLALAILLVYAGPEGEAGRVLAPVLC